MKEYWRLDPNVTFLNHGSFGACPAPILAEQTRLRAHLEAEPVRFFLRELPGLAAQARSALGAFIDCDPDDLAFVANATSGVNTVVRSLDFAPGDEILTTDHAYAACKNALAYVAERSGARVVVAKVPFPLTHDQEIVDAVLAAAGPRTRLAMIDHVTSPTGIVFPVQRLCRELSRLGVQVLVDGAHAPGMVPLSVALLAEAGASYYTGNCHKWLCTPKGSAFLWVARARQDRIRPLTISHGADVPADKGRFRAEFDWTGTIDPTPFLCIPAAIQFLGGLIPDGWNAVRARNHALAVRGRAILCEALQTTAPCPETMLGALAAVPLPDAPPGAGQIDPLHDALFDEHHIEVPIVPWPRPGKRLIRISAQLYNDEAQMVRLAEALTAELAAQK